MDQQTAEEMERKKNHSSWKGKKIGKISDKRRKKYQEGGEVVERWGDAAVEPVKHFKSLLNINGEPAVSPFFRNSFLYYFFFQT